MLEKHLKKRIRNYLHAMGAYTFSPVQMGMGGHTVDILACLKGRFIGVEVKVPGKKPTPRQYTCIHQINMAGGYAFWTDDFDDFKHVLSFYNV